MLHAQHADDLSSLDERHDDERAGLLLRFIDAPFELLVHAARILDQNGSRGIDDVAEDAGVERLRSCAHALAAPFMNSELEYPPVAVDEHEIELVEAEQAARLGEDALAELVHSSRPVQHAPDVEQLRDRSSFRIRRAQRLIDTVEAQHEHDHEPEEEHERRVCTRVVKKCREDARRKENQIGSGIRRRDDAPNVAPIELEERRHGSDVDDLRRERHGDERKNRLPGKRGQRVISAERDIEMARGKQHERGHRGVMDASKKPEGDRSVAIAPTDDRPNERSGRADRSRNGWRESQQQADLRDALHRDEPDPRCLHAELPDEERRKDRKRDHPEWRESGSRLQRGGEPNARTHRETKRVDEQHRVARFHASSVLAGATFYSFTLVDWLEPGYSIQYVQSRSTKTRTMS